MSCYICNEKTEIFCKSCSQRVCKYDSSVKIYHFERVVICNLCNFATYRSSNFQELQSIHQSTLLKLQNLESHSSNLGLELNNLLDSEILLSRKLESIQNLESDSTELLKNKLLLEETSKNNALQSASRIYKAIENQSAQNNVIKTKLSELQQETNFLSMLNSHKTRENLKISTNIQSFQKDLARNIDMKSAQKVLCAECQVKIFGSISRISILLLEKDQNKACAGCCLV